MAHFSPEADVQSADADVLDVTEVLQQTKGEAEFVTAVDAVRVVQAK